MIARARMMPVMAVSELVSGLVTGEFYSGSVDTPSDPDVEPDYAPAEGSGILVPSIRTLQVTRADGSHYNVQLRNFAFKLISGLVKTPDGDTLRLVANVNQYALINPTSWAWTVTNFGVDGISYNSFNVNIDPGVPCDLAVASGVPVNDTSTIVTAPGVSQAAFDAFLVSGAYLGYTLAGLP